MNERMTAWISVRLLSVSRLTPLVFGVELAGPRELTWGPGQYIALKEPHPEAPVSYYSLASAPDAARPGVFELAVGKDSTRFFERRAEQSELLMSAPAGGVDPSRLRRASHLVLVGMGTGITPLRATVQWTRREGLSVPMILLAGARFSEDQLYQPELSALPLLDYRPVLSRPDESWAGRVGRVQLHLEDLPRDRALYYVCGSRSMAQSVATELFRRGVNADNMICEGF